MESAQPYTVDKSTWGDGPWQREPDKLQWKDEATGLPCLIVRSDCTGALCGYVGVPPDHPAHGKAYSDVDVSAHGGITYANGCGGIVCHVPEPGQPDNVWWIGFDCAHAWDLAPGIEAMRKEMDRRSPMPPALKAALAKVRDIYRDVAYVQAECADLAKQLAAIQ